MAAQICSLQLQLETSEKQNRAQEAVNERLASELESLRHVSKSLISSQTEIAALTELVAELKRSAAEAKTPTPLLTTSWSGENKDGGSSPRAKLESDLAGGGGAWEGGGSPRKKRPTMDSAALTDIYGLGHDTDLVTLPGGQSSFGEVVGLYVGSTDDELATRVACLLVW